MVVIRAGLLHIGQVYFKDLLHRLTNTAWKGLIMGTLATALLQSSSAVLVITVGLVATGLLSFRHSIGIILGANIGTTMTTELLTLNLSTFIIPFLLIGFLFLLLPSTTSYATGCLFLGLACIFVAMDGLEMLAQPLASIPFIHSFFHLTNEHPFIGLGIGMLLTAIIQSSTATIAITMGFLGDEAVSLLAGIAIMLGANIGTCVTAFLASVGAGKNAQLVAYANIWLNLFGVLLFLPFIQSLAVFVSSLTELPMAQLAHASFFFNLLCSLFMLPFISPFSRFIEAIYPEQNKRA